MEVSKIHLSSSEMELMQNAEVILTKNRVLEKIRALLEEIQEQQIQFVSANHLATEIFSVPPKISKGENYLGLPYLILDYPRQSSQNHFFFIRTLFWWGNFFSCTLHLANDSKKIFERSIRSAYGQLKNDYVGIKEDPWVHRLEEPDYRKISSLTKDQFDTTCERFAHLKIAARYPLTEWEKAPAGLFKNWKFFLSVCGLVS